MPVSRSHLPIGVVGLGYVGVPLSLAFTMTGKKVVGFDIDPAKPRALMAGDSYISYIPSSAIASATKNGLLDATTDFSRISETGTIIICVPTPLDEHLAPDLSYVRSTIRSVRPYLQPGHLISLESTTYPGTTEEEIVTRVEEQGFKPGEDIFVVYSPEREDPGNKTFSTSQIPKVVGGYTSACLKAGMDMYGIAFQTVPVSSCRIAELTKLLENIYRAVNIGLVNEMKVVAQAMGIDIWEVIKAASTKPFGFSPFYPGPGLGGHCIPIDPFYLTWKAREVGVSTRFIELAGQINRSMPEHVVRKTMLALNDEGKSVKGSRILLIGLAYKPDVDDVRESPTFELMSQFADLGAVVEYHDPHCPQIGPTREHKQWLGKKSTQWSESVVRSFDAVVVATHHSCLDLKALSNWAKIIIDTRNALGNAHQGSAILVKA